jgi:hypothetical protein
MSTELNYTSTTENEKGPIYEFETDDYPGNQEEYVGPIKEATPEPEPKEDLITKLLKKEAEQEAYDLIPKDSIYHLKGEFWDDWDKVKGRMKKLLGHMEIYPSGEYNPNNPEEQGKMFFLAHSNDTIKGKPQLVEPVKRKMPLVREVIKKDVPDKDSENKDDKVDIVKYFTFDERVDKRYDGYQARVLAKEFWIYRVIENGTEHYVWSEEQLPNDSCEIKGMLVPVDDYAELSRSLKLKSISGIFILKEYTPAIKVLEKEDLINITTQLKEKYNFGEGEFYDTLAHHPLGTFNIFSEEFQKLKASLMLSGKKDGTPNHLMVWGSAGTKKSMGILETTQEKIQEEIGIREGGDSNLKSLIPSYKFHPADIGYLAKCLRMGFVDELGKLVEFEMNKHQAQVKNNILGEINMFLDNKERTIGSGVQNDIKIQSTGKFIFASNPVSKRETIENHIGLIDPTTMSRCLQWVIDENEKELVFKNGVSKVPPTYSQAYTKKESSPHIPTSIYTNNWNMVNTTNNRHTLEIVLGENSDNKENLGNFNPFLSIYDSCQVFLSQIDEKKVQELVKMTCNLISGKMRSVWEPRAEHHIFLLIDGLCKVRCLFRDFDKTFIAKQEDYDWAERILIRMINSWKVNMQPKEDYS